MNDLLQVVYASDKRRNLLIYLRDGPKEWDEIKHVLKVTSTGMLPQVKILEEAHLIEKNGKVYALTALGRIISENLAPFLDTLDTLERYTKFWQEHDIGILPIELLLDIRQLGDYQILEIPDADLFNVNPFLDNLSHAKFLQGISHTLHPRFPQYFLNLAQHCPDTSLILTPSVFSLVVKNYRPLLLKYLAQENAEMYVNDKDVRFSCAVSDSYFSLSLFYNTGNFDSKNDIISRSPSAILWGKRLFAHYKKNAKKVEQIP
ncbi:MAG: winged helix-turn-helix domain-containing protein [Methanoregula sp.]|jgi:predicted transcriptional regulator